VLTGQLSAPDTITISRTSRRYSLPGWAPEAGLDSLEQRIIFFFLPGSEHRLLGRGACNLLPIPTELLRLLTRIKASFVPRLSTKPFTRFFRTRLPSCLYVFVSACLSPPLYVRRCMTPHCCLCSPLPHFYFFHAALSISKDSRRLALPRTPYCS
jgi:hypothetical protein